MNKIFRNSSYLLFSQTAVKFTSFLYTIFLLGNLVDVNSYGIYTTATAYFSLFSIVSDFGINRYLTREIAKDQTKKLVLFSHVLILRSLTLSLIFIIFAIVVFFLDPLRLRSVLTILAVLAVFPQIISLTLDSIFIAVERFDISALGVLILNVTNVLVGIILINLGFDVYGAVFGLILSQIIYAVIMLYFSSYIGIGKIQLSNFASAKKILIESLPYGFLSVLGLLYFRVDTLLLSYLKGTYDTGIYGAAYKFLDAIVFVPSAISATLFPIFSRLSDHQPKTVYLLYKKALFINLGLSLLVVLGYLTILPMIINLFLPRFNSAVKVIQILTITIPFMFMISPQALVLLSKKSYLKPLIIISIFNLIINVALNLIFIPKYSYIAAAWITVFSDIISFLIFFVFIKIQFSDPKQQ